MESYTLKKRDFSTTASCKHVLKLTDTKYESLLDKLHKDWKLIESRLACILERRRAHLIKEFGTKISVADINELSMQVDEIGKHLIVKLRDKYNEYTKHLIEQHRQIVCFIKNMQIRVVYNNETKTTVNLTNYLFFDENEDIDMIESGQKCGNHMISRPIHYAHDLHYSRGTHPSVKPIFVSGLSKYLAKVKKKRNKAQIKRLVATHGVRAIQAIMQAKLEKHAKHAKQAKERNGNGTETLKMKAQCIKSLSLPKGIRLSVPARSVSSPKAPPAPPKILENLENLETSIENDVNMNGKDSQTKTKFDKVDKEVKQMEQMKKMTEEKQGIEMISRRPATLAPKKATIETSPVRGHMLGTRLRRIRMGSPSKASNSNNNKTLKRPPRRKKAKTLIKKLADGTFECSVCNQVNKNMDAALDHRNRQHFDLMTQSSGNDSNAINSNNKSNSSSSANTRSDRNQTDERLEKK